MADKVFKTIDEQIEILKSRGLTIEDKDEARRFLLQNNYYRISGYSLTLRKNDVFEADTTLRDVADIYNFDHRLRHVLLENIETIEVRIKSIYAYEFTKAHGPLGYRDSQFFTDKDKHKEIISDADRQKQKSLPNEMYLKHFCKLKQEVPLWAYVDLLTISKISFLYSISNEDVKRAVSTQFGLTMNRGPEILGNYMHSMTILRNLCAHGSRIYNRLFEQKPSLNKKERARLLRMPDGTLDDAHLYGYLLVMERLLSKSEAIAMEDDIAEIIKDYSSVDLKYYGFPENWKRK